MTYRTSTSSVYYLVVPLGKRQHSHSNAVKNTHTTALLSTYIALWHPQSCPRYCRPSTQ